MMREVLLLLFVATEMDGAVSAAVHEAEMRG
jgi:hypothetical protein